MNDAPARIARYDPARHDSVGFSCGNEMLDRWLMHNARRDAARTFVAASSKGCVHGYNTLVVGEIGHDEATASVRKGLSRHFPIPVVILARLAVDRQSQGRALGARLLAVRAVLVHAIDDRAAGFYERFGFRAHAATPRTLVVTLAELRAAGYGS